MDEKAPTVDRSLDILSEAVGKAADDFRAVRTVLDRARADIASHNTSVSRTAVAAAERVVDHLKKADDALKEVLVAIEERD
jgi:alkylation response protein AidB-like acyl-CoA dehydrogenase